MGFEKNSKGLTLLELVMAVVVLGVIAALSVPRFGGILSRLKFKSMSRDIVSDMRLARSDAVSQRAQSGLCFDYSQNGYILFKDKVNPDLFTYEMGDSLIKTVSLGQDLFLYCCTFNNNTIVFKPDGSACCSGSVTIARNQGGELADIDVLASTGRVRLAFRYTEVE